MCCNIDPETEKNLMHRIAEGDRGAFGEVVDWYMKDIFGFAYSIMGDSMKAEDVTQETCLRLWNKAGQWKPSGRIKSWLLKITHNLCMDELRKQKPEIVINYDTLALSDNTPSPLHVHADWQRAQKISEALVLLPERQRTALMLVYYQEHSNKDAADIMGVSVDALESLLSRGRKKLKELLLSLQTSLLEG